MNQMIEPLAFKSDAERTRMGIGRKSACARQYPKSFIDLGGNCFYVGAHGESSMRYVATSVMMLSFEESSESVLLYPEQAWGGGDGPGAAVDVIMLSLPVFPALQKKVEAGLALEVADMVNAGEPQYWPARADVTEEGVRLGLGPLDGEFFASEEEFLSSVRRVTAKSRQHLQLMSAHARMMAGELRSGVDGLAIH